MAATRHNTSCSESKSKVKLRSFKSSEHMNENGDGPYHGFGYLSFFSDVRENTKRTVYDESEGAALIS